MGLTKLPNGLSSFGIPVMGGGGIPAMFGNVYFVDYAIGVDGNSGIGMKNAVKTLSRAYALATSGNDDVILVRGGSPVQEDAMITWEKNKVHVFGLGAFGLTDPEPRIIFSATGLAVASAPAVIKVTGWANTFTNFRINSWGVFGTNQNVCALWDAGEGNVFTKCQFNKFTDLGVATVSDVEARGDSTTWYKCKFGFDTLEQTAARPTLWIKGTGANARMKNNMFETCIFRALTDTNSKVFIKVYDNNSLAFMNTWRNCEFGAPIVTSQGTVQLLNAVESSSGLVEGELHFIDPASNCASFCAGTTDRVKVSGSGMLSFSGTDPTVTPAPTIGVGVTPT